MFSDETLQNYKKVSFVVKGDAVLIPTLCNKTLLVVQTFSANQETALSDAVRSCKVFRLEREQGLANS